MCACVFICTAVVCTTNVFHSTTNVLHSTTTTYQWENIHLAHKAEGRHGNGQHNQHGSSNWVMAEHLRVWQPQGGGQDAPDAADDGKDAHEETKDIGDEDAHCTGAAQSLQIAVQKDCREECVCVCGSTQHTKATINTRVSITARHHALPKTRTVGSRGAVGETAAQQPPRHAPAATRSPPMQAGAAPGARRWDRQGWRR